MVVELPLVRATVALEEEPLEGSDAAEADLDDEDTEAETAEIEEGAAVDD